MNPLIARIGKYLFKKNELVAKRQRARSKAGYYKNLLRHHGSSLTAEEAKAKGVRGFVRWNKPGKKQELRLLCKKHTIEQMQIEVEIHELVISARKELNKIRKDMPFNLNCRMNKIEAIGILRPRVSPKDNRAWRQGGYDTFREILYLKEIEQIVVDQDAENILLRGVI
jgi:hypothetical protein